MKKREPIKATEGHILTNGAIYGRTIYLADDLNAADFYEITLDEYNAIVEDNDDDTDIATEDDYKAALREMGVGV
jgi:hypothetical protein